MKKAIDKSQTKDDLDLSTLTGFLETLAVMKPGESLKHSSDCNSMAKEWLPRVRQLIKTFRSAQALKDASSTFIAKLDMVHNDPRYQGVWGLAQTHYGPYDGPQYNGEMELLKGTLAHFSNQVDKLDVGVTS